MIRVQFPKIDVGKNISCMRKIRGNTTQAELADKLGITQSAVSQFERNGDGIHARTLEKIADALDVDERVLDCFCLYDENDINYTLVTDTVRNYPKEDQLIVISDAINSEIEQRSMEKTDSLSSLCMSIFNSLNDDGKNEAIKRINELAQLSQYKKED